MAKNKLFACLLAGALALSLTACGKPSSSSTDATSGTSENPTSGENPGTTTEEVSVDFEDGKFGFVAPYLGVAGSSEVELSIADFGGSKALKIDNVGGKTPYIGIDVTSLLGDKVADVATIEANFGVSYESGKFSPVVGVFTTWTGEDLTQTNYKWTVYLENKNPYKGKFDISATPFVAGNKNIVTLGLNTTANGVDAAAVKTATIYVDNIRFLDKDGKIIVADTSAEFDEPDGFAPAEGGELLTDLVTFEGFEISGGAWGQNGLELTEDFLNAIVPGSVIEVTAGADMADGVWILFPDSSAGWMRVGAPSGATTSDADTPAVVIGNKTYITYEQIVAVVGEDKANWGARLQCESNADWAVVSVKVGKKAISLGSTVDFEGFETSGGAWGQNGFDLTEDFLNAIVPGSIIEVTAGADMADGVWILFPDSSAGWMRVGAPSGATTSDADTPATVQGNKTYITYEQIVAVVGEDKANWGARLQCESNADWAVVSVKVGTSF